MIKHSLSSSLARPLTDVLSAVEKELLIISPYVGMNGATHLINAMQESGIGVRLLTKLDKEDMVRGATSIDALRALAEAGVPFRTEPRLHAKLYTVDRRIALLGSANLTNAGLDGNHELVLTCSPSGLASEAVDFAEDCWRNASPTVPTEEVIRKLDEADRLRKKLSGTPEGPESGSGGQVDLVYIPKNAKEAFSSFEMMLCCADWRNSEEVSDIVEDHEENVRDVLDFGAYIGLLEKYGVRPSEGYNTTHRLTDLGRRVCHQVMARQQTAVQILRGLIVQYAMPNRYVNVIRNPEHMEYSVRPWLTLLRLLRALEAEEGYSGDGFSQNELSFVTLSVFHESPQELGMGVSRLLELDGSSARPDLLNHWVRVTGDEPVAFKKRTAGIFTRLCRWPGYLGLIDCDYTRDVTGTFYELLDASPGVRRVMGLTDIGRSMVEEFDGTRYSSLPAILGVGATHE